MKRKIMMALVVAAWAGTAAAAAGPSDQLKTTVDGVIAALKNKGSDASGTRANIRSLVGQRFYFRGMAQSVLGPQWRSLGEDVQAKFTDLFSQMLVNLYLGRIEAYTDEKVEFLKERVEGKRAQVDTQIVTKQAPIPIRYNMTQKGDDWLVYDVVIEGVSLLRNYQTSYREIARNEGMDGLLGKIEQKVHEQENGAAAPAK